jgi:hypothetical protein
VELDCFVADHLYKIQAENIGNYVVLSNLYAADARWDGAMEIRKHDPLQVNRLDATFPNFWVRIME